MGGSVIQLRKQLAFASAAVWLFWIASAAFGWGQWGMDGGTGVTLRFVVAAVIQISLWIGLVLAAGLLVTHILIVRDNELYEPADADSDCDCSDGCCSREDQSNISS